MTNAAKRGVKTLLIIDDLNFYASREDLKRFREAGGLVIKNNPFEYAHTHLKVGKYQKFFNRNHQKCMLIDSHVFIGSLNVADPYSGTRYGDSSFRDLNIILRNQDAKDVRSFFLSMLVRNEEFFPEIKISEWTELFIQQSVKYTNES